MVGWILHGNAVWGCRPAEDHEDPQGREIARGLVNYDASETRKIMGSPSHRIVELLGYVDEPELIHRDNLVLMGE